MLILSENLLKTESNYSMYKDQTSSFTSINMKLYSQRVRKTGLKCFALKLQKHWTLNYLIFKRNKLVNNTNSGSVRIFENVETTNVEFAKEWHLIYSGTIHYWKIPLLQSLIKVNLYARGLNLYWETLLKTSKLPPF